MADGFLDNIARERRDYRDHRDHRESRDYRNDRGYGGGRRDDYSDRRFSGRGSYGGGRGGRNGGVFEGFGNDSRRSPTPEDTIPISKRVRKFTAWDVKASGFENYTAQQAKMTGMFTLPGQTRPPLNHPSFLGAFPVSSAIAAAAAPSGSLGSAARQARRLYVGNITTEATEENLTVFFNAKMKEMNFTVEGLAEDLKGTTSGVDPVIGVHLNYEKNYAFVELRNPEEATNGLGLDGVIFQSNALKIRRPKDYVAVEEEYNAPPGVISTNVPDTINKIFIGGLPSYLNDDQVMELLKSFGELKAFNLVKEGGSGVSKGFAFCEYLDPAVTEVACQGLNGMELGDRHLVVQRAALGANPLKYPGGMDPSDYHNTITGAGTGNVILSTSGEGTPTRVLQILNMVAPEELTNDSEFGEIVEDIKEECLRYGEVMDVKIPRPIVNERGKVDIVASEKVRDLGKVFVMFKEVSSTKEALKNIAGRQFGGRMCICAYASEEAML